MSVDTPPRSGSGTRPTLLLGIAALAVAAALVFAFKVSGKMPDFEVYWRAAQRFAAGEPLYRPEDGHWLFKYLPAFAMAAAPLTLLPLRVAKALWFLASVAALAFVLRQGPSLLPELHRPRWVLIAATLLVMGKFYAHELLLGQTNLLLVAVVIGVLLAWQRRQEALAGVLVVVAIVLKPHALILLPWLLARRKQESIVAATIGMVVALAAPALRYGFDRTVQLHLDWWHTIVTSTEPNLLNVDNVSWLSMYSRWFQPGHLAQALTVGTILVSVAIVARLLWLRQALAFPELLEGALLLTVMPLISPQGWDYTLLVATPAVMCLVNYNGQLPSLTRVVVIAALAIIGLSIFDLMGRTAYGAFMSHSSITLCFFVVLGALAELRRRQIA